MPHIQKNVSLKPFNTFHVEAYAKYFVSIQSPDALSSLIKSKVLHDLPKLILGGGSNILLTQDFHGLVIKINIKGIEKIKETENYVWLAVAAGEDWHSFVKYCVEHDYAGVENLILIPGTTGAAVVQNAGAYGMEITDTLQEIDTLHLQTGNFKTFFPNQCRFAYRSSCFKSKHNPFVVTRAIFKLCKYPQFKINYASIKKLLEIKNLTLTKIADVIVKIRQKKLPDFKQFGNAGSFFKNPVVPLQVFNRLSIVYPAMPHWKYNGQVKLAAAWLIEKCGWKGKKFGQTGVYEKHALVLLNYGHASGLSIKRLADDIVISVFKKFNIRLESEVLIL